MAGRDWATALPDFDTRSGLVMAGAAAGGVAAAAAVVSPLAGAGVMALSATLLLLALGPGIVPLFHGLLGVALVGYTFLNRGFAHVGGGGVFISELVVAVAVFAILARVWHVRLGIGHLAIALFMAWGAFRTFPYVGEHGLDAFRDGVAWGYAIIAIAVSMTMTRGTFGRVVEWYRRLAPLLVWWIPVAVILTRLYRDVIPTFPGADVPILFVKPGDAGVHLGGVAAFILVGLFGSPARRAFATIITWVGWFVSLGLVAALNRGGMLSAAVAGVALLFIRRLSPLLMAGALALGVLALGWLLNPQLSIGGERELSFQQITTNVTSIVGGGDPSAQPHGTAQWRLEWWDKIVGYTVDGPYFWTGKGYGVNLADADDFQVLADGSLRSPHSAHFEILARSGVPGLATWLLLNAVILFVALRVAYRAWKLRADWWLAVLTWIVVVWLATIVNMSFDVYLAGPMGGFVFWACVGAILALDRILGRDPDGPSARAIAEPPEGESLTLRS